MKKNDEFEIGITDMTDEGLGVGKKDGFTLFVKDSIVGDTVLCGVTKLKKNYGFARTISIIKPSPDRVEPVCLIARQCGGCQLQQMSYEAQLSLKEGKVRNALIRIGGFGAELIDDVLEPIVPSPRQLRYRNKAQYPIGKDREGRIIAGFYAGHTHSIIACEDCLLGSEHNRDILDAVISWMENCGIEPYDERSHKGLLRHVLIRKSIRGDFMVCLVINGRSLPKRKELIDTMLSACTKAGIRLQSLSFSSNTEITNVIMGDSVKTIYGEDFIEDSIRISKDRDTKNRDAKEGDEICFRLSPLSFYQVNPLQMEQLYAGALEFAGLNGTETVWDLYCGIGTISLFLAKQAGFVYGVEIVPQAIEDAKANARRNGIANTEFFVGKAEEVLPRWYAEHAKEKASRDATQEAAISEDVIAASYDSAIDNTASAALYDSAGDSIANDPWSSDGGYQQQKTISSGAHPDVIVVDPPRKGCDEACLDTMVKMQPKRIVYVSCNPATLARDLKYLTEHGYELKKARPYDMFPQSVHVETVVLMSRVKD